MGFLFWPVPIQSGATIVATTPAITAQQQLQIAQAQKTSAIQQAEESTDLEELEQFARTFKQRRIKLGFTQVRIFAYCMG